MSRKERLGQYVETRFRGCHSGEIFPTCLSVPHSYTMDGGRTGSRDAPQIFNARSEMHGTPAILLRFPFRCKEHHLHNYSECLILSLRQDYFHLNLFASHRSRVAPSFSWWPDTKHLCDKLMNWLFAVRKPGMVVCAVNL